MELRMDKSMEYIQRFREKTGKRLTVTHLVAKAIAQALKECPDANAVLRFNRIYLKKNISVFMQVAMTDEGLGKVDLSGITLYDVDKKSLAEISDEVQAKVDKVRKRQDPALEKTRGTFAMVPFMLLNLFLKFLHFVTGTLNIQMPGIPRDPLGSVMVTNIGSLGLDVAYPPLVPYSNVPIVLATGAVKDVPVVDDGKIVVGKVMKINATFDHRFIDGFHAAVMSKVLHKYLEDPFNSFDKLDEAAPAQATG
jgi:pyruvate dehydrogenase E2 component (dihydrolipoamide acetyltransferase)